MAAQEKSHFRKHVGIDIGSSSVKLASLEPGPGKYKLVAIGDWPIPENLTGAEKDVAVTEGLKQLVKEAKVSTKLAAISLPESQVYSRVIEMPYLPEPELTAAIRWQAEQYIPVPLAEVVHKHVVLRTEGMGGPGAKMEILLVAAPMTLVNSYMNVVSKAGLEVIAVETELFSVVRSTVEGQVGAPPTLVVDFGADGASMGVVADDQIALVQPSSFGSRALTRAIAKELNLQVNQAEEYKKSYGLDEGKLEGKVSTTIRPIIESFVGEIKKVLAFYATKAGAEGVRRILLTGGGSLLEGLVPYLTETVGVEVLVGNPFWQVELTEAQAKLIGGNGAIFATSTGLALKEV